MIRTLIFGAIAGYVGKKLYLTDAAEALQRARERGKENYPHRCQMLCTGSGSGSG